MVEKRENKNKELEEKIRKEERRQKKIIIEKKIFKIFFIILLIFISIFIYMHFIGTSGLIVKEYKIASKKIPDSFHGIKIVHFSDLHYKNTINKKKLKSIIDKINEIKPDIVVFTGDLLKIKILMKMI